MKSPYKIFTSILILGAALLTARLGAIDYGVSAIKSYYYASGFYSHDGGGIYIGDEANPVQIASGNTYARSYYMGAIQALKYYADDSATYGTMIIGNGGGYLNGSGGGNTAKYHTFAGVGAGANTTTTDSCTFIGFAAGNATTTADNSTAVGFEALRAGTTGCAQNTAVGYQSLENSNGANNTGIGYNAGDTITTGTQCVYLGSNADASASGAANEIAIGYSVVGKGNNTATIGLLATAVAFYAPGAYTDTTGSAANLFVGADGRISRSTSSSRYKIDIKQIEKDTSKIYEIEGKEYKHLGDGKNHVGLIAEEVAQVMPEAVIYNKTRTQVGTEEDGITPIWEYSEIEVPDAIDWNVIVVALIEENKKLKARIEKLEAKP